MRRPESKDPEDVGCDQAASGNSTGDLFLEKTKQLSRVTTPSASAIYDAPMMTKKNSPGDRSSLANAKRSLSQKQHRSQEGWKG